MLDNHALIIADEIGIVKGSYEITMKNKAFNSQLYRDLSG